MYRLAERFEDSMLERRELFAVYQSCCNLLVPLESDMKGLFISKGLHESDCYGRSACGEPDTKM